MTVDCVIKNLKTVLPSAKMKRAILPEMYSYGDTVISMA